MTGVALSGAVLQALVSIQPAFAGLTLASDSFNRTITAGWGTADVGGAWTIIDRPSNWSVTPGSGVITVASNTVERAYLGAVSVQDVDLLQKVVLPRSTQNDNCLAYLLGRFAGGASPTYYRVGVFQGAQSTTITLRGQRSDGVLIGDANTGIPAADGVVLWVRAEFQGVNPTAIRARAWVDGSAEPASWQLTGNDSNAAEQIAGSVGIRVKNEDTATAHTFTIRSFQATSLAASPSVASIAPASGPAAGGIAVTIGGTNFTGATSVQFGATAASSFTVNSASQITAISPTGSGTVDVTVTTPGGTSATGSADQFTYVQQPAVTGLSPTNGPAAGGTAVTISGANFTGATGVKFGAAAASSFTVNSATQITATSPSGSGTVDVTVTTAGGSSTASGADQFTYVPRPTVTGLSPSRGATAGGTVVTITGTGLSGTTNVNFGAAAASGVTVASATQITAASPAGSGTVDVTATTPGGTSATGTADQFTYVPQPAVTGLSPTSGPSAGGTAVTITGAGFTGATAVKFGGTGVASFTISGDTQITTTSPAGSGTVDVTVTTAGGASATGSFDQFTYVVSPPGTPVVSSVSPGSGPSAGGTAVIITGTALTGATAVSFGATAATSFTVNRDTQITATTPAGSGTVDITVTTAGGASSTSAADQFAYLPVPSVTGVNPASGPTAGGTVVTITGTGLSGGTTVKFGATAAGGITVNSPNQITATSPAGTGTVDVTVTTAGGNSAAGSADRFTYVPPPAVTGLSPSSGPAAGGTVVTITGTALSGATRVSFGSVAAGSFSVLSSTQITATSPSGSGAIDVTITTAGGSSATGGADLYTYVPLPVVTGLSPTGGPTTGATAVTITGSAFTGATTIRFGASPATTFTVNSDTQISATSPAGSANVDVTVTTPGGTSATSSADQFAYAPVSPTVASDTFNRTVITGWGTADVGGPWSIVDTPANWSVSPGAGSTTVAAGSQERAYLSATSVQDVEILTKVVLPKSTAQGNCLAYVLGRYIAGSVPTYYRVGVGQGAGDPFVIIRGQRSDNTWLAPDVNTTIPAADGAVIWFHVQFQGVNPTAIRARAWLDGTTEPSLWSLDTTDSNALQQAPAAIGMRMRNEDTTAHAYHLESFTASSMTPRTLPTGFATDAFNRTVSGGWGTADIGGSWSSGGSAYSVVPGRATVAADPTIPSTFLTANSAQDVDMLAWLSPPTLFNGTATSDCGVAVRYMTATGAYYQLSVYYPSSVNGTNYVVQLKRKPDNFEINPDFNTSIPGGTAIWLRLEAQGVNPTTLRWKVWQDGTAEPAAWTATGSDSTPALQGAGGVGVEAFSGFGSEPMVFNALTATRL